MMHAGGPASITWVGIGGGAGTYDSLSYWLRMKLEPDGAGTAAPAAEVADRAEAPPSRCLPPAAVRAYDVRGRVGDPLRIEHGRSLGLAYAALARAQGLRRIAVGRDGRLTSPALEAELVAGLADGGMEVTRIGLGPTPMTAFAVRTLGLDGGVVVTASHNPPDENGFKIMLGAERIHGAALRSLAASAGRPAPGGSVGDADVRDPYLERLLAAAADAPALAVAWDAGSGATGEVVERLAARLPGRHVLLSTRVDGRFPDHHPDPAVESNLEPLKAAVLREGCDLGVAFDGDGDRIGVVDETGAVIWADQLLLFLAGELLREHPGATVVGDVKSSGVLFRGVEALGGRAVVAPSGYVLIREAMRREGALLAGELSGHVFFADRWDGTDDALYVAVRLLCALGRTRAPLSAFRRALPPMLTTPELRIACPEPRKAEVVAEVAARTAGRGGRYDPELGLTVTGPDGWWLLRASGTEPKLTCRCEAPDAAALERLRADLRAELSASGVALP